MPNHLVDDDYILTEGAAWFDVKGFAIRIHSTDEGIVVDVFSAEDLSMNSDAEIMASTYAYDADLLALDEPDDNTDDGEALASAGHGTDEDYGSASEML